MNDLVCRVKVFENKEIEKGIFIISFQREKEFKPGQSIEVAVQKNATSRGFSICSGPNERDIKILYKVHEGGEVPAKMSKLKPGDNLYVSEPFGFFIGTLEPAYWIASGTGVAPFHSMLKSGMSVNKYLIHGAPVSSRFYFHDEFERRLGSHYIRCAAFEKGENIYEGRVSDFIRIHPELPLDNKYYLCGNFNMVEEVRDTLIERGVAYSNILSEIHT